MKINNIYIKINTNHIPNTSNYVRGCMNDAKEFNLKVKYHTKAIYVDQFKILITDFHRGYSKSSHLVYDDINNITFLAPIGWINIFFMLKPVNYNKYWEELNQ